MIYKYQTGWIHYNNNTKSWVIDKEHINTVENMWPYFWARRYGCGDMVIYFFMKRIKCRMSDMVSTCHPAHQMVPFPLIFRSYGMWLVPCWNNILLLPARKHNDTRQRDFYCVQASPTRCEGGGETSSGSRVRTKCDRRNQTLFQTRCERRTKIEICACHSLAHRFKQARCLFIMNFVLWCTDVAYSFHCVELPNMKYLSLKKGGEERGDFFGFL